MPPEANRMKQYGGPTRPQQAREMVTETVKQAENCVQDYPASAVLVTFGLGCALGYLATALLAPQKSRPRSWYDTAADSSSQLGRRISEAVMNALPETVTRHM